MKLKRFRFLNTRNSISNYKTDDKGQEIYPKLKNNSEYYLYDINNNPIFTKNTNNAEIYALDCHFNQIYPKKPPFFAKNRDGEFYYAKDFKLNEYYPTFKGLDRYTWDKEGNALIARFKSGRQRYPSAYRYGDYYPRNREGKPFYLLDENNVKYLAKSAKGENIYLEPPVLSNHKYVIRKKKDALKNIVYIVSPKVDCKYKTSVDIFFELVAATLPLITTVLFISCL